MSSGSPSLPSPPPLQFIRQSSLPTRFMKEEERDMMASLKRSLSSDQTTTTTRRTNKPPRILSPFTEYGLGVPIKPHKIVQKYPPVVVADRFLEITSSKLRNRPEEEEEEENASLQHGEPINLPLKTEFPPTRFHLRRKLSKEEDSLRSIFKTAIINPPEIISSEKLVEKKSLDWALTCMYLLNSEIGNGIHRFICSLIEADASLPQDHEDLKSILHLTQSKIKGVRDAIFSWIFNEVNKTHPDIFSINNHNTSLKLSTVLSVSHILLKQGIQSKNPFELRSSFIIGLAIATKGLVWEKRMGSWQKDLQIVLLDDDYSSDVIIDCLKLCTVLVELDSCADYYFGCLNCLKRFPEDEQIISLSCSTLRFNTNPADCERFFIIAKSFALKKETNTMMRIACQALLVVQPKTQTQARNLVDCFNNKHLQECLKILYHSPQFSPQAAQFLNALILKLEDDTINKVKLCNYGVIIPLIRLASPLHGDFNDGQHQTMMFKYAIEALKGLVTLPEPQRHQICTRIVLAGGLGPLFLHANSSRILTRGLAKSTLTAMGAPQLEEVVLAYMNTVKEKSNTITNIRFGYGVKKRVLVDRAPEDFDIMKIAGNKQCFLGQGAFGVVYKVNWFGRHIALKRLSKAAAESPLFLEEIRLSARIEPHDNIIQLFGVHVDKNNNVFILNELGGSSLRSLLKHKKLSWKTKLSLLHGISEGMKHLHGSKPSILHLDLKSDNILISNPSSSLHEHRLVPKICDFGLAVELIPGFECILPGNGTIQYMAPEVIRDDEVELSKGFDEGADVYSFSMIMWEIAQNDGRIPWEGEEFVQTQQEEEVLDHPSLIHKAVLEGRRPEITFDEKLSPNGFTMLLKDCWAVESESRPRFYDQDKQRENLLIGSILQSQLLSFSSS